MKTTWLAEFAEKVSITFEKFNPALFRLLATVLPYATPLPVAWYTSRSAQTFLHFTPGISGVFVFGLEGMGILFTSLFVDSVIDWIRSRNVKTFALVAIFGVVVIAYVYLLVNLNVTLEQINNPDKNSALSQVITLMCFLPLLTGIGNGYYKWKLESKSLQDENAQYKRDADEREKERRSQERIKKAEIQAGINHEKVVYALENSTAQGNADPRKSDWRQLTDDEKYEARYVLSVPQLLKKYNIGKSTAYAWKKD